MVRGFAVFVQIYQCCALGFRGFGIEVSRFGDLRLRGFEVRGYRGCALDVRGSGFRGSVFRGSGFMVSGSGFGVRGLEVRGLAVTGFGGFAVRGFEVRGFVVRG